MSLKPTRRSIVKALGCGCAVSLLDIFDAQLSLAAPRQTTIADEMAILPPGAIQFSGFFERYLRLSIERWAKAVLPYSALVEFFRSGRPDVLTEWRQMAKTLGVPFDYAGDRLEMFAAGEMWGKAVRSSALMYRYTGDAALKEILRKTVAELLSTKRANGTISLAPVAKQPDGPGGDLWERKYVLLGLDEYYRWVEADPAVLKAMMDEADATIQQVGPPPRVSILEQGWSPTKIESSTLLEPIMRLYRHTGQARYLDFARYIVESGGAKGHDLFAEIRLRHPKDVGGVYPKAYEMTSLFEGLVEYYRVTRQPQWRDASLALFEKVIDKEITITGNAGADEPYHPKVQGEAWDNTKSEQTNPRIRRTMETCVGVTWMKFCHQILRLTADPKAVDCIELYAYNSLLGAMKPTGDAFSYVNRLNGVKTEKLGWGATFGNVYLTCCNLNGPMGLAFLPLVALMQDHEGAVVNLYNACTANVPLPGKGSTSLKIETRYPLDGDVRITVSPASSRRFALKLRIPAWSANTGLRVNGEVLRAPAGSFVRLQRLWREGDVIELSFDMRARLLQAPLGSTPHSDAFRALVRGPIVLCRDENIDPNFNQPVDIVATDGIVAVEPVVPTLASTNLQFKVPTRTGPITMVDYASVDSWQGKRIQTWLPIVSRG